MIRIELGTIQFTCYFDPSHYLEKPMMTFTEIQTATLDQLTDELAAAGWESTQTDIRDAREAVARLLNETSDLRLYDSETGDLITSEVSDDQASEAAHSVGGHIVIDGRKCYVDE